MFSREQTTCQSWRYQTTLLSCIDHTTNVSSRKQTTCQLFRQQTATLSWREQKISMFSREYTTCQSCGHQTTTMCCREPTTSIASGEDAICQSCRQQSIILTTCMSSRWQTTYHSSCKLLATKGLNAHFLLHCPRAWQAFWSLNWPSIVFILIPIFLLHKSHHFQICLPVPVPANKTQ